MPRSVAVLVAALVVLAGAVAGLRATDAAFVAQTSSTGSSWQTGTFGGPAMGVGDNADGQLGTGGGTISTFANVSGAGAWKSVGAGGYHSCGVKSGGTLWCWGSNSMYQLGQGGTNTTPSTTPLQVGALSTWDKVAAGSQGNCAIRTDGTLWCWGYNVTGPVGDNTTTDRSSPTQEADGATWSDASAGTNFTCGVRTNGTLWCWGLNNNGQVGDNSTTTRLRPTQVGAVATWSSVSNGWQHACATRTDASLWCWGNNASGQIGAGASPQKTPVQVGSTVWSNVSAGNRHTCAVRTNGTLWCWGRGTEGQLGRGSTTSSTTPVQVGAATDWSVVELFGDSTCATKTNDVMYCWGDNYYGQLGIGNTTTPQTSPVQVTTPATVTQMGHGTNIATHHMIID